MTLLVKYQRFISPITAALRLNFKLSPYRSGSMEEFKFIVKYLLTSLLITCPFFPILISAARFFLFLLVIAFITRVNIHNCYGTL